MMTMKNPGVVEESTSYKTIQGGAAVVKDQNYEIVKDNARSSGRNFVNDKAEYKNKIRDVNYSSLPNNSVNPDKTRLKNNRINSRCKNTGYNSMEYDSQEILHKTSHDTCNTNTKIKPTKDQVKPAASTGTHASMIKEKVSAKSNIRSEDHKKQNNISQITDKQAGNMVNNKLKDLVITNNHLEASIQIEEYKQSKKQPRYKAKLKHEQLQTITNANSILKSRKGNMLSLTSSLAIAAKEAAVNYNVSESDDLGVETVFRTKKALELSKQSAVKGKSAIKLSNKAIRKTARIGKRAADKARKAAHTVRTTAKLTMNPLVIKTLLIIAFVAVILISAIASVSSVVSFFAAFSFSSKSNDLNDTYKYITELDTEIQLKTNQLEKATSGQFLGDTVHYYSNFGILKEVDPKAISINTDATRLIVYLTTKYDDFDFRSVKDEVKTIHSQLYKIIFKKREETQSESKKVKHLDIIVEGISFDEWQSLHGGLDPSQRERYENTLTTGALMLQSFGSPFVGVDWRQNISSRFGYRVDPVKGIKEFHDGVDISLPSGTKINSVSEGTASVKFDPDGYGKYVTVTSTFNGNTKVTFIYGHCNQILVSEGQKVRIGDVLATVGSTGKSTGSHLHLTYKADDTALNPEFYLE